MSQRRLSMFQIAHPRHIPMMNTTRRPPDADLPMVKVAIARFERQMRRDLWTIRGVSAAVATVAAGTLALLGVPSVAIAATAYVTGVLSMWSFGHWMLKRRDQRASKETP